MSVSSPLEPTPDLSALEARCRDLWQRTGIYEFDPAGTGEVFSVDTPPPYVSAAHLHVGHAMSYAQADFIVRYQRMRGRRAFYPMGFDDNGLPTERYVERKYGLDKSATTRAEFRRLCLAETEATIATYETLWRALGLSVDWRLSYSTIDDHCRATAQRSFIELFRAGRIYRSQDPVFWDPSLGTALAQADLETLERQATLYDIAFAGPADEALTVATTRPELLAACVALYCHPDDGRWAGLAGSQATTPIFGHRVAVHTDCDVDPTYGSGLMMVCTFGDSADLERWRRDGLATRTIIDETGRLTADAGPYEGMTATQARAAIVADLASVGALTGERRVPQRVAVSERSGAPVEFVLRPQWFLRLLDLRAELTARADEMEWYPAWARQRLLDWIDGLRYDWNLSRQRYYGVAFPVWLCTGCGQAVLAEVDTLPVDPTADPPPLSSCPGCGETLQGDPDVMDTWMTSSLTPQILTNWVGSPGRVAMEGPPLTLRVQAHEIVRSWLFYTLAKSHLHADLAPWGAVMISGWGLNEAGRRISKRDLDPARPAGTYSRYDPEDVIAVHGADALRHWASRAGLGQDVRYREREVRDGRKVVLKLWNIARLCQPCLRRDGSPTVVEDRWLVAQLNDAIREATASFERFDYAGARRAAEGFMWVMADDWLEMAKDRLWNPERHRPEAFASVGATMSLSLRNLLGLLAPFLPFITEALFQRLFADGELRACLAGSPWPIPVEGGAVDPAMTYVLAVLRTARTLRSEARLPQGRELPTLVVEAAADSVRHELEAIADTLRSAARVAEVTFGPATRSTGIPGVNIDYPGLGRDFP